MSKEKVKKALSKIGIAGLAAGVALFAGSAVKAEGGTSCGKGSCGGAKGKTGQTVEQGKSSCGAGVKMDEKAAKEEDQAKAATTEDAEKKKKKKTEEGKSSCGAK